MRLYLCEGSNQNKQGGCAPKEYYASGSFRSLSSTAGRGINDAHNFDREQQPRMYVARRELSPVAATSRTPLMRRRRKKKKIREKASDRGVKGPGKQMAKKREERNIGVSFFFFSFRLSCGKRRSRPSALSTKRVGVQVLREG
ncbi:hypothetical protein, unlikely [Trypanosoma congolense IL3000]|uniref:Uncharacterized protein n=1 Tax=Trypanosoma congolense (strain IL3000) TaxID=1068625 RepID=F9WDI5_TRYCI|nr:hypothetical protein, unlikely [Trypanosoma congolense IL3000]